MITGAAVWTHLRPDPNREKILAWLEENWHRLILRRERRAVRTTEKMTSCLYTLAAWVPTGVDLMSEDYETMWNSAKSSIYGFGRYATMKMLEVLSRGSHSPKIPDIRPVGGWSPRLTLAEIFPGDALLKEGNGELALSRVATAIDELRGYMAQRALRDSITHYEVEVLLCNYRQALTGRYPGRSHDTDLKNARRSQEEWGRLYFPFFEWRREMFPRVCLGEIEGWTSVRDELETTPEQFGYFWSDTRYDYHKTTDFSKPIRREDGV